MFLKPLVASSDDVCSTYKKSKVGREGGSGGEERGKCNKVGVLKVPFGSRHSFTTSLSSLPPSLNQVFVGVILIPIVGNATEHMTAVSVAYKNRMELAMGIAVGSATQIR